MFPVSFRVFFNHYSHVHSSTHTGHHCIKAMRRLRTAFMVKTGNISHFTLSPVFAARNLLPESVADWNKSELTGTLPSFSPDSSCKQPGCHLMMGLCHYAVTLCPLRCVFWALLLGEDDCSLLTPRLCPRWSYGPYGQALSLWGTDLWHSSD